MTKLYGQLSSEKLAEENAVCRQIVSEINRFGVTERQQTYIIYLLALQLENNELMLDIVSVIKNVDSKIFVMDQSEDSDGTEHV